MEGEWSSRRLEGESCKRRASVVVVESRLRASASDALCPGYGVGVMRHRSQCSLMKEQEAWLPALLSELRVHTGAG